MYGYKFVDTDKLNQPIIACSRDCKLGYNKHDTHPDDEVITYELGKRKLLKYRILLWSSILLFVFVFFFFITSKAFAGDTYSVIKYGRTTIDLTHEYVQEARTTSSSFEVGIGYRLNDSVAVEATYVDLGTYRFLLEKNQHIWRNLYIDVPGYAELRVTGPSLGAKFTGKYFNAGISAFYAMGEAELHTPVGYRFYERAAWVPSASLGLKIDRLSIDYKVLPKASSILLGVEFPL